MKRISLNYELYKYLFLIALFIFPLFLKAQNIVIQGRVIDKNKQAILGATVFLEKSTKIATVTDADGLFDLSVPQQDSLRKIVVSGAGFKDSSFVVKTIPKDWVVELDDEGEVAGITYTCVDFHLDNISFWQKMESMPEIIKYVRHNAHLHNLTFWQSIKRLIRKEDE